MANQKPNVLVVGGGPSGLMAAIAATSRGAKVVVLEQMDRPGLKLLATGGGRCNLTNTAPNQDVMAAFGRQGRFMSNALAAMDGEGIRRFFADSGVPTVCPDGFEVYPESQKSADVLNALLRACKGMGVEVRCNQTVDALLLRSGKPSDEACRSALFVGGVRTGKEEIRSPRVVLCCGGRSYPTLGATGGGYALAAQAGHTLVPPTPAGVGLVCRDEAIRECAGVSAKDVRVWIDLPKFAKTGRRGDLLFTHRGLSGPAVLDLSGDVAELLASKGGTRKPTPSRAGVLNHLPPEVRSYVKVEIGDAPVPVVPLRIDLTPDESKEKWSAQLDEWGHNIGARQVRYLLAPRLTQAVAELVCQLSSISPITPMAHVDRPRRDALVANIKSLPAAVTGTEGFDRAIVTRGGVALKEVDPRTLQSRLAAGLFFAGELMDLDGPCGGYNLTWAFSSGHLAGLSAGDKP